MRRPLYQSAAAILAVCVVGLGVARYAGTAPQRSANPEDGQITDAAYVSNYFNLSYQLPGDWTAGLEGPAPSSSGYYVVGTWIPKSNFAGTVLIAAQDMFFAEKPDEDVGAIAVNFRQVMSSVDGMTIDREPSEVTIGGHIGRRVDFSGVGLYRSMFATEIRCHVVTFNFTTRDPELLERLARSLDHLDDVHRKSGAAAPECIKDYVVGDNVVRRVEPAKVDPSAMPIPVRIVVTKEGYVRDVHVIRATAGQKKSIEEALHQWKLKPYVSRGQAVEIETGVMIRM